MSDSRDLDLVIMLNLKYFSIINPNPKNLGRMKCLIWPKKKDSPKIYYNCNTFFFTMISLPRLTFIIIAIRSFLSIVILYELSKCLKILIKKIPGPSGPKVSAGRHACCLPGMLTRRCTGAGRVLASGRTKRPFK